MWSLDHVVKYKNEWVPSQSSAARPPRLYVRTAAAAPLQPIQLPQENTALNTGAAVGDVHPLLTLRQRPALLNSGRENPGPATARLASRPASHPKQPAVRQSVIVETDLPLIPDAAASQRKKRVSEPRAGRGPLSIAPKSSRGYAVADAPTFDAVGSISTLPQAVPKSAGRGEALAGASTDDIGSGINSSPHYICDPDSLIRVIIGSSLPNPAAVDVDAAARGAYDSTAAVLLATATAGTHGMLLFDSSEELLRGLDRLEAVRPAAGVGTGCRESSTSSGIRGVGVGANFGTGPAAVGGSGSAAITACADSDQLKWAQANAGDHAAPPQSLQRSQPLLQNQPYDHHVSGLLHSLLAVVAPASPLGFLGCTPSYEAGDTLLRQASGADSAAVATAAAAPAAAAVQTLAPSQSLSWAVQDLTGRSRAPYAPDLPAGSSSSDASPRNASPGATAPSTGVGGSRQHAASAAAAFPLPLSLLGPSACDITVRSPAAVSLIYAAAGVCAPAWARDMLPSPVGSGLRLDPALEWALGVLSPCVSPSQSGSADLRLANSTLAAHLGPPKDTWRLGRWQGRRRPQGQLSEAGGAAGGGGGVAARPSMAAEGSGLLPWPLLLPLVETIGERLNASGALALLRFMSRQAPPSWRTSLPPRQRDHLEATVRASLGAALRNPRDMSLSTAAGLLSSMARFNVRNSTACRLLVERLLEREPRGSRRRVGSGGSSKTPLVAAAAPASQQSPHRSESDARSTPGSGSAGSASRSGSRSGSESWSKSTLDAKRGAGRPRSGMRRPGWGRGPGSSAPSSLARHLRLQWVMMALAALSRLRVDCKWLPRACIARLFRCALWHREELRPSAAAALLVCAARLRNRLPFPLLRLYGKTLLRAGRPQQRVYLPAAQKAAGRRIGRTEGQAVTRGSRSRVAASAVSSGVPLHIPKSSLLAHMHGSQLIAALEALDALYGRSMAAAVHESEADDDVQGRGLSARTRIANVRALRNCVGALAAILSSALSRRRLQQLSRQQACKLLLVLSHLGVMPEPSRAMEFVQPFVSRARQLLPGCDAIDMMLLLSGLRRAVTVAEGAQAATEAAAGVLPLAAVAAAVAAPPKRPCRLREAPQVRKPDGRPAAPATSASQAAAAAVTCLYAELADEAVRWYLTRLPHASLHHTASILQSVGVLWSHHLHILGGDSAANALLAATDISSLAAAPTTTTTTAATITAATKRNATAPAATTTPAPASVNTTATAVARAATTLKAEVTVEGVEIKLQRRRVDDMVLEREFLLQQLGEHLLSCLMRSLPYSGETRRGSGGAARGGSGGGSLRDSGDRGSGGDSGWRLEAAETGVGLQRGIQGADGRAKLAVMVLNAYHRLSQPPPHRLLAALEALLAANGNLLGAVEWEVVREAYRGLRLQPGGALSVAMLTFA